ncbi:MAG: bifunctional folylpolyglutamate synthase/dihydrofolate synthase [Bacteroidetes bacterium]|nr:bifunctional folylpolyglutamate synthase/dihydrofolate synthase [Bacteroidota bacterium]
MDNYPLTLEYLYAQLPMFHRIGAAAYKADLDNTYALLHMVDNPHLNLKCVHVAGTNGKGSVSHCLASILQEAGYKTGLYTSPHLKDFRERIRINGKMISKRAVVEFVRNYRNEFEQIKPSFFEWTVALAFDFFHKQKVDIAIIETGLGGRLDSTNVIQPLVSVITNISFDHQNLLGNTLEQIAFEKAGIIKNKIPVVIGEYDKKVSQVFISKAKEQQSYLYFASQKFKIISHIVSDDLLKIGIRDCELNKELKVSLALTGNYQLNNVCTIMQTVALLRNTLPISNTALKRGLTKVVKNTGLQGRWQQLNKSPLAVCDTGHNQAGIQEVLKNIRRYSFEKLHIVIGVVNDKDVSAMLKLLPAKATYYFCKPSIPRGLDVLHLQQLAASFKLYGEVYTTVRNAYRQAIKNANKGDFIFVGGSTFVVAEVI